MATLFTEIQFLSPQKVIVIKNINANGLGISDQYQLSVKFDIVPKNNPKIKINFAITILNDKLFSFENNSNLINVTFIGVKNGDVRLTPFSIKNIVPLTGMQLVLLIESNDVNEPFNKDFDSETYDVKKG